MILRDYQETAVAQAVEALEAGRRPCVVLPTGSGKSGCGAELLRHHTAIPGTSAYSITHTRELIRQNSAAFREHCPSVRSSTYSAGLGEKDLSGPVVFAGVQSLVRAPGVIPFPALTLVDEAARIPYSEDAQYSQVIARLGAAEHGLCGLTATPYRMDGASTRLLTSPCNGAPPWFDVILQPSTTAELQAAGWLSPLVGVSSRNTVDVAGVHTRMGEFVSSELEEVATEPECVKQVCQAIAAHTAASADGTPHARRKILVFAVSVAHSEALRDGLFSQGISAAHIDGTMGYEERDEVLAKFRSGEIRALVNCMILTMGYDDPNIDCIACVRPTQSKGLWVQMVGRGLRRAEGKQDCLILDLGGNWRRHGSLDGLPAESVRDEVAEDLEKAKREAYARSAASDPKRYAFGVHAGEIPITDGEVQEARVFSLSANITTNKRDPRLLQLRICYLTDMGSIYIWLLPEHKGGARWHSGRWFARRGLAMPYTAHAALAVARSAPAPESISVRRDGNFWRVIVEHFPE